MKASIEHGYIYEQTEAALNNGTSTVIHRGGTSSGKTFDIMLFLLILSLQTKGEVITVVSESMPHIRIGTERYLKNLILKHGLSEYIRENRSEHTFTFPTGTVIEFFSADRIDKALGGRRYLLFGNEINSLKFEVWDELARRSKLVIADFNPTTQFWLEDKFLPYYTPNKVILSNYLDNPFCPPHERKRIEARAELDPNFKRIHVDCEYGNAEDLVFLSENILTIDDFPSIPYSHGLDFGYVNPSALLKVAEDSNDNIYIDEIIYRGGMNESDFRSSLASFSKADRITADSEDARMISYLQGLGYNIAKAKKGAGSVDFGISYLQGKRLHFTKRSVNALKEFRNLMHAKDRLGNLTGKYSGEDHTVDAVRYAIENTAPPGGDMFKTDRMAIIDSLPLEHSLEPLMVRYWSKADKDGGAYICGVKMVKATDGKFIVIDVQRGQWNADAREANISTIAQADGNGVDVGIEQESGSGGEEIAINTMKMLKNYYTFTENPKGDKIYRADPWSVQVNRGNVLLLAADWNHWFIEDHRVFPFAANKDQVNAAAGAFAYIAGQRMAKVF